MPRLRFAQVVGHDGVQTHGITALLLGTGGGVQLRAKLQLELRDLRLQRLGPRRLLRLPLEQPKRALHP